MNQVKDWIRSLNAGEWIALVVIVVGAFLVGLLTTVNTWSAIVDSLQPEITGADDAAHYDLVAQRSMSAAAWWMVMITGLSVGVGAAGLYLILRTLQEAKRSADAAENAVATTLRIGKQQVRAYLNVEDAVAKLESHHIMFTVDADLRNSGQSPAQEVGGKADLRFVEFFTYPDGEIGTEVLASLHTTFRTPAVGAGQTVKLRLTFAVLGMKPPIGRIFNGYNSRAVEVHVVTEYNDVFDDRHITAAMLGSIASSVDDFSNGMGMRVSSPEV
jgi:hypothetical protein